MSARRLAPAVLAALAACAAPAPQQVRVVAEPADAACVMRQGAADIPLAGPERIGSVTVSATPLVVECRRAGYETATVQKYAMQYSTAPTAGPLLLLLDKRSTMSDSYPSVIRVTLDRNRAAP